MNIVVYVFYPLLFVFLFWRAKLYGKKDWNEEVMSLSQTKALQGFCAICIMLHHIGQKTSAPWLKSEVVVHGLDVFVPIGYFFVGIFLFCSGYGLYKSYKAKPNYLQGFFGRRALPLILAFVSTSLIFAFVRLQMGSPIGIMEFIGLQVHPYAWFVITLLYLYLSFYLVFRYCKNEKVAVWIMGLAILLYIGYCDWFVYGTWWYNSVILFGIGLLFARHEDAIFKHIKKHYILYVILAVISMLGFYFLSTYTQQVFSHIGVNVPYEIRRWVCLLAQMAACSSFVFCAVLLGMKVRLGNKALAFMGTITLEFYLIHGVFVELFGYCFLDEGVDSLLYIRNPALYVLMVAALSIPLAYILRRFHKWFAGVLMKKKEVVAVVLRDVKRLGLILLILIVCMTFIMAYNSHKRSRSMEEKVESYAENNMTYAEVDGKKMSAYVAGKGEHTIVLLRGISDPCPTITLKPLADYLAEKNRVIVLDYFGSGFSDDTDQERTADNIVYEIHTALKDLGEEGPYIFMPHEISGIYTQLYSYTYPDEIEAVIGLDTSVAEEFNVTIDNERLIPEEYIRVTERQAQLTYLMQRTLSATGYVDLEWSVLENLYSGHTEAEMDVLREVLTDKFYSRNAVDEMKRDYKNSTTILGRQYSEDLPVLFILAKYTCNRKKYSNIDWMELHENLITNPDIQNIEVVTGNTYFVYRNTKTIAEKAQEFIDQLDVSY